MTRIKAEQSKGEREALLDTYIQNEKVKGVKDKIDQEKLKQTRELYNGLPLDNDQLKVILDNSVYNPKYANENIYTSIFELSEKIREINQVDLDNKKEQQPQPKGAPKNPTPPAAAQQNPITNVPPKPQANMNMFGTEFKNSADSSNKYNDDYKGKSGSGINLNASKSDNEYHPIPTTGEGIPRKFQKYIQ